MYFLTTSVFTYIRRMIAKLRAYKNANKICDEKKEICHNSFNQSFMHSLIIHMKIIMIKGSTSSNPFLFKPVKRKEFSGSDIVGIL